MSGVPASCFYRVAWPLALAVLLAFGASPVRAGVFDDVEARQQVKDLATQTAGRFDTLSTAQFELVSQIQTLRDDNAKLRGQVETLNYQLEQSKKRQQDFYLDLDNRLRKLETAPVRAPEPLSSAPDPVAAASEPPAARPPVKVVNDPAAEAIEYEAALNLFKSNKIKDAANAFETFVAVHPEGSLTPNAQYWVGNAYYSLRDCKRAIAEHRRVVERWPQNAKAPDALVNIATCEQELGDGKAAKAALETVMSKYPDSSAAATAKQRLKK